MKEIKTPTKFETEDGQYRVETSAIGTVRLWDIDCAPDENPHLLLETGTDAVVDLAYALIAAAKEAGWKAQRTGKPGRADKK